jgi:hypothetical protein
MSPIVWFWLRIKGVKLTPVIFSHGPNNGLHVEWRVKKDRIISADVTDDTPENYRCFSTLPVKINYIYTQLEINSDFGNQCYAKLCKYSAEEIT